MREPGGLLLRLTDALGMSRLRETVLLPAVADMQYECSEARSGSRRAWVLARGYASIVSGCAFYAALLPSRHVRENWAGLSAPGPRLLRMMAPVSVFVAAAAVMLQMTTWPNPLQLGPDVMALLLPSFALTVAPLALAIGVASALTRDPLLSRAALGVGLLGAAGSFIFFEVAVAPANQAYRLASYRSLTGRQMELRKGSREMTFRELWVAADTADASTCPREAGACHGTNRDGEAWLRSEWHKRLSIPMLAFSFVVLAAGLSKKRRRLVVIPGLWLSFAGASLILQMGQKLGVWGYIPVVLGAWAAHLVPLGLAGVLLAAGRAELRPRLTSRTKGG